MSIYSIKASNISYDKKMVFEDISFDIDEKGVYAILGKSAHARTVLAKTIVGIVRSKTCERFYKDIKIENTKKGRAAKGKIAYLPKKNFLYNQMTVYESLDFVGAVRGVDPDKRARQIKEALELVMLSDKSEAFVKELSVAEEKRALLASALIGNPAILVLDEPTMHLPPDDVAMFKEIITMLGERKVVILLTDRISLANDLATHIGIISNKRIALWSSLDNIKQKLDNDPNALLKTYSAFTDDEKGGND